MKMELLKGLFLEAELNLANIEYFPAHPFHFFDLCFNLFKYLLIG